MSKQIPITTKTLQQAAQKGIELGFGHGWDAARLVVETIKDDPGYFHLKEPCLSILQALDMSRTKALEMMCPELLDEPMFIPIAELTGNIQ